ncbi:MAG: ABC transporter permease [Burkholderiaceae bacterium]|nr:ABC transporter permease [Burkholderiaceae bacterium]
MKGLLTLAAASAWHRRVGLGWVLVSVALSTFLLLAVERLREDLRTHFSQSVSGTDLIVGPRTGAVQLMLYAVFRVGDATQNIRWQSVQALSAHPRVAWAVPISLGDSHRGFPVVGTTSAYFEHFRYGQRQPLQLAEGRPFAAVYEAVLGAEVAERLGYRLGDAVVLSHGSGAIEGSAHDDKPFTVVGILARTGTPVDRSLHIGLEGMEALHLDWFAGLPMPGRRLSAEQAAAQDLTPRSVTALLLGLKSRAAVFSMQREVAAWRDEPLMAVLPGVALDQLWEVIGAGERALTVMSALVAGVSLAGLVAVVLTGLEQRRRELAVLRALGAGPRRLLALLLLEGALVTAAGALLGALLALLAGAAASPWLERHWGIALQWQHWGPAQLGLIAAVLAAGTLAALLPGWRAYRLSLADGLQPRG